MADPVTTPLRFGTIADLKSHVDRLAAATVTTTGTWSFGQVLFHLAASFDESRRSSAGGDGSRRSRFATIPHRMVGLRRSLPTGVPIPEEVRGRIDPPRDADRAEQHTRLVQAIDAFESWRGGFAEHPVFGPMNHAEWRRFHLRHCELHLAHVVVDEV